ncbi:hypothetical protein Acsp03_64340 [Actinomadura sp. NBRC 104412]|uniref:hypothetical protein n=1 Tax=Actinomadura sp. NBRC 104412 TaxID=3032203 RepID=UPI0024A12C67|nr:hypothetical protein [Actinomadura sp. NBRC 104412]GLZ08968.1 hypothetical protein Acsp03_64340 [Actinomadura sp. NBRC 104412]
MAEHRAPSGEVLTSGAMPPDWTPPKPREDPYSYARRWAATGMPGGMRVDSHPGDVSDAGIYTTPEPPPGADVRTTMHYQRAAAAGPSPYVLRPVNCTGCGTHLGTYYGHADHMPDQPRCRRCTPTTQPPPTA